MILTKMNLTEKSIVKQKETTLLGSLHIILKRFL